jgi:metal-responsive CopG/Arc/MetJ family transcriptional regulator
LVRKYLERNAMARKRKSAEYVGVSLRFPTGLLAAIDRFAKEEFCTSRADAISELLARGLTPRTTAKDMCQMADQAMREGLRGE